MLIGAALLIGGYSWLSHSAHQKNPKNTTMPNYAQLLDGIENMTTVSGRTERRRQRYIDKQFEEWQVARGKPFVKWNDEAQTRELWEADMPADQLRAWKAAAIEKYSSDIMLYDDAKASFSRFYESLIISCFFGFIIGLLMGCFRSIEAVMTPALALAKYIAPTAALAVFFALLGTREQKFWFIKYEPLFIGLIAFGVIPHYATTIMQSVRDIPRQRLQKGYTMYGNHLDVIMSIVIPQTIPYAYRAAIAAIGPTIIFLIAAEWAAADTGFGYQLRIQSRLLAMNIVYPYLIILAGFAFGLTLLLRGAQKIHCPWFSEGGHS